MPFRGAQMECLRCKVPMQSLDQLPVRTGGTGGGWHLLLGVLADSTEQVVPLDVYRCQKCTRLELFDLDRSIPEQGGA